MPGGVAPGHHGAGPEVFFTNKNSPSSNSSGSPCQGSASSSASICDQYSARATASTGSYRPGSEADTGVGLTYDFGKVGVFSKVAPLLQVLGSWRVRDSGTAASLNSGYRRLLDVGPGVDVRIDKTRVFMDVELPVLQYVETDVAASGNVGQLTASAIWKMQVAYDF